MVDFSLSDEERQIRDTVRSFIEKEVMPLEPEVLRNERAGQPGLDHQVLRGLQNKARRSGFWGVNTPEEYGGMDLGAVMSAIVAMECGRSFVPFVFGGYADNILYAANEEQRQRYLIPTIEGERISCFAITEPGAGSDARNIRASARKDGGDYVINGEKTFITRGNDADFVMVFAVVPDEGITCFLVDRDMGWKSEPIPTMGEWGPAALVFEDVRVPASSVLGEVGKGFELAMQWIRQGRYLIPARAVGSAERLLQMAIDYAKIRVSMGHPIADYQAIQWKIADSAGRHRERQVAHAVRRVAGAGGPRRAARVLDRQARRGGDGQRGRRPGDADPRRHGLHQGTSRRTLVPRAAPAADLRGHRRDPASHHRAQPAQEPRQTRRDRGVEDRGHWGITIA